MVNLECSERPPSVPRGLLERPLVLWARQTVTDWRDWGTYGIAAAWAQGPQQPGHARYELLRVRAVWLWRNVERKAA